MILAVVTDFILDHTVYVKDGALEFQEK